MMIEHSVYETNDGRWIYHIEPDFKCDGFPLPLYGVRKTSEDAGWALAQTGMQLSNWYWRQQQISFEFSV